MPGTDRLPTDAELEPTVPGDNDDAGPAEPACLPYPVLNVHEVDGNTGHVTLEGECSDIKAAGCYLYEEVALVPVGELRVLLAHHRYLQARLQLQAPPMQTSKAFTELQQLVREHEEHTLRAMCLPPGMVR